jgi:hypothetical protein
MMRDIVRPLLAAAFFTVLSGCTTVKFVQKNPYTGEIWTVYSHLGSDSLTYCSPIEGQGCLEAEFDDGPPPPAPPVTVAPAATAAPTVYSH